MKKMCAVLTGIYVMCLSAISFAQVQTESQNEVIKASGLAITNAKTTNLIFPYPIKSVDRGSIDVLVQKALGLENVLQVKAAKAGFEETNLTVVTSDGSLFSYLLNYSPKPVSFNIRVNKATITPDPMAVFTKDATTAEIEDIAGKVSNRISEVAKPAADDNDISLTFRGAFVHKDMMYFKFHVQNSSSINYHSKGIRFFIKDKKKSKRTSSQEIELTPSYILGNVTQITNRSGQNITFAINHFTLPNKKFLSVELMEQDGGRNLELKLQNKHILKAVYID
jgi:conjugative transposon TraN protein